MNQNKEERKESETEPQNQTAVAARQQEIFNERVGDLNTLISNLLRMYDFPVVASSVIQTSVAVADAACRIESPNLQNLMYMSGVFAGISDNLRRKANALIVAQNARDAAAVAAAVAGSDPSAVPGLSVPEGVTGA